MMNIIKPFIVSLAILVLGYAGIAYAAPYFRQEAGLVPITDSIYYLGTTTPSTIAWLSIITDQLCLTADTCRTTWPTGGSSTFSWTPTSWGVSTSTTLGFLQGFLSTASSTIDSNLRITGNLLVNGNSTTTNATSTNFFSTTASSTNLFSAIASFGNLTLGTPLPVASGGTGNTNRTLTESTGDLAIDWENMLLADGSGNTTVNWLSGLLREPDGSTAVNWFNQTLHDAGGTTRLDFSDSVLDLTGDLIISGNSTTTNLFSTTASTTNFFGGGLITCQSGNVLTYDGAGRFGCTADAQGAGTFSFTPDTYGLGSQIVNATSTGLWLKGSPLGLIASTTFATNATTTNATTTNLSVSGEFDVDNLTSALTLTGSTGVFAEYTGTTCTNQFVRVLSALGAATCATVGAADVSLANLTATDATLTFSGTYNGSTARTIGINLANPNTWTGLQTITNASTTNLTAGTFFQVPTGTAMTSLMEGALFHDTTSDNLIMGTTTSPSATAHVVIGSATTTLYAYTASTTAIISGTTIDMPSHPLQQVATSLWCKVSGGTSLVIFFSDTVNDSNSITCTTTGTQYAIATNNVWTSYEAIRMEFGTKTGDTGYLSARLMGYRVSD